MANEGPPKKEILTSALGRGENCLSVEQMEQFVGGGTAQSTALAEHVESCVYCKTEIDLLREFQAGEVRETETDAVQAITARLRARSNEIFGGTRPPIDSREPWWRVVWRTPWLTPATLALAAVVLVVAIGLQVRNAPPGLHVPRPENEILRSNAIRVLSPSGDVNQVPREIAWERAPNAVKYHVRLLEVDGSELWGERTDANSVELPAAVRARIVPSKTLLCEVQAFDADGHKVAQSETARFRFLQKVHKP